MNQPLMTLVGYTELVLLETKKDDPNYDKCVKILEQIEKLGEITSKLMQVTIYKTKRYGKDRKIIDIDRASDEIRSSDARLEV